MLSPGVAAGALGAEFVAFYLFQFRAASFWVVLGAVFAANVVSTIVGLLVFFFLPSPEHPPDWLVYVVFLVAWSLSVAVEYGVYCFVGRWRHFVRLPIAVVVSNIVSYSVLGFALWYQTRT
jgi:hypothetical protein